MTARADRGPGASPAENAREEGWLLVAHLRGMGAALYHRLRALFDDPEDVLAAPVASLAAAAGVPAARMSEILAEGSRGGARDAILAARGRGLLPLGDRGPGYPEALAQIVEPPPFLWIDGALDDPPGRRVAIVGTRRADARSCDAARELACALALRGYAIVSGLAVGVDTAAHEGALEGGGRTIAVLAGGLDAIYPPENEALARRIASRGALVSQYPWGMPPLPNQFLERNRTIAGLSRAVVVAQAPARSGALSTARAALDAGRDVLAMPGPVGDPRYVGSNRLLRDGARVCLDPGDVVAEVEGVEAALPLWNEADDEGGRARRGGRGAPAALSPEEERILESLPTDPLHVDGVSRASGLPPERVLAVLLGLEMKGAVRALPGKHYARRAALGSTGSGGSAPRGARRGGGRA